MRLSGIGKGGGANPREGVPIITDATIIDRLTLFSRWGDMWGMLPAQDAFRKKSDTSWYVKVLVLLQYAKRNTPLVVSRHYGTGTNVFRAFGTRAYST